MTTKDKNDLHIPFAWEDRRSVYLDRFFYIPKAYDHFDAHLLSWSDSRVFGNDKPVFMEICSGNGQWITDKAIAMPDVNWVAIEMRFDRARKIWLKAQRNKLPNLYVVCADANPFLNLFAPPVDEVYVNFPDPWPKRQYAKNRLIWAPFIQKLQKLVRKNATLVTDDEPYHNQMVQEFIKAGGWERQEFDGSTYGDSYFAKLWKGKGKDIFYLRYQNVDRA